MTAFYIAAFGDIVLQSSQTNSVSSVAQTSHPGKTFLSCVATASLIAVFLAIGTLGAIAETEEIDITLNAEGGQTFDTLLVQAEAQANSAIAQAFADPNTTVASVRIMGERFGQSVPVLFVTVSREDWQADPNLRSWARYFGRSSLALLGFLNPQLATVPGAPGSQPPALPGFSPIEFRRQLEEDPAFRDD